MKQQDFQLRTTNNRPQEHITISGYAVGNFFVYKGRHYWRIAHVGTHSRFIGDFARRKDVLAVVGAMDSNLWDFDVAPATEQLENLYALWTDARSLCENINGILRLPENDVSNAAN